MDLLELEEKEIKLKMIKVKIVSLIVASLSWVVLVLLNLCLEVEIVEVNKLLNIILGGSIGLFISMFFPITKYLFRKD